MTTLLEYVCEQVIGPPTKSHGNGESQWPCPKCTHPRFHTLPHHTKYKDRFRCWSCPFRGDVFDLLRHYYPRDRFPELKARLTDFQAEYDRLPPTRLIPTRSPIPLRGVGRNEANSDMSTPAEIDRAWAAMTEGEKATMAAAVGIAKARGVDVVGLAYYCFHSARWFAETDAAHMAECDDAECDWRCCRFARGWSWEDIAAKNAADETERDAERVRSEERVRHALRNVPKRKVR